jgi:valyl-tRNA synthetase
MALYDFVWMIYCDWFIELMKPRVSSSDNDRSSLSQNTISVALKVYDGILRLLHPIMPYLTEELWHILSPHRQDASLGFCAMPQCEIKYILESSLVQMREIQNIVSAIRTIRGQFQIHPAQKMNVYTQELSSRFGAMVEQLEFLTKSSFHFRKDAQGLCAPCFVNGYQIFVSLDGLIDKEAEKERLKKKIMKLEQTREGIQKRLQNKDFVSGAPEHILKGARQQEEDCLRELSFLKECFSQMG